MMRRRAATWTLLFVFGFGCGDDGNTDDDGDPAADGGAQGCELQGSGTADLELRGLCPQESHIGTIALEIGDEFSFLDGKVSNAVVPSSVRTEEMSMGGCRLMRKEFPFCDPACTTEQTCTFEGICIPVPRRQDLGEVCVAGLSESHLLTAEAPSYHYFNTQLPHPAVSGGERIEVRSAGGIYGEFEMAGTGVTPMQSVDDQWNIVEGEDLVIGWSTSDQNAHTAVNVSINIDQHGSAPLLLECEFPDTGSASVPNALIGAMLGSGVSGFPNGRIERASIDSVDLDDGCIDFVVRAPQTMDVRVANHTPCTSTEQCPGEQICNLALETCE